MISRTKETISAIQRAEREAGFLYFPGGTKAKLHKEGIKNPADVEKLMVKARNESLRRYRKFAKKAAIDFYYGQSVLNAIDRATSEREVSDIMAEARRASI